jgi:hypothetical protein
MDHLDCWLETVDGLATEQRRVICERLAVEGCDGEELAAAPAKMLRHLLNGVGPEAITLLIAARDAYIAEL